MSRLLNCCGRRKKILLDLKDSMLGPFMLLALRGDSSFIQVSGIICSKVIHPPIKLLSSTLFRSSHYLFSLLLSFYYMLFLTTTASDSHLFFSLFVTDAVIHVGG